MYIPYVLQKFCIFPGHLHRHQGCFIWVLCTSQGHKLHFYMCMTSLFQTFTHQIVCVHPVDAPEIPHFPGTITQTPGLFSFGFSAHPWDKYFIFICASHTYSGHLPTKLFVYILQMLQIFCIFLGHLLRCKGCFSQVFCIYSETITWTPGLVFLGGFSTHPGTCTAFLHVCDMFI